MEAYWEMERLWLVFKILSTRNLGINSLEQLRLSVILSIGMKKHWPSLDIGKIPKELTRTHFVEA